MYIAHSLVSVYHFLLLEAIRNFIRAGILCSGTGEASFKSLRIEAASSSPVEQILYRNYCSGGPEPTGSYAAFAHLR
jgi:hypothetical protein